MAGVSKSLGLTIDYVLHEMSYANLNLYSASLPTYRKPDKDGRRGGKEQTIRADDPKNRDLVRDFINQSL